MLDPDKKKQKYIQLNVLLSFLVMEFRYVRDSLCREILERSFTGGLLHVEYNTYQQNVCLLPYIYRHKCVSLNYTQQTRKEEHFG